MNKKFKNILLLYKRSAYKIYFLDPKRPLASLKGRFIKGEFARFKKSHDQHYNALHNISRVLYSHGVRFTECYRGKNINYSPYDLVITVGGDGTFLEAVRKITNQVIIGVNSAPQYSVGRFCIANAENFEKIVKQILAGKFKIAKLHQIQIQFSKNQKPINALNDVLICHQNPAMLCRYYIEIGRYREEQRSSGIWISTAVGSTGAIKSAGGKILPQFDKLMQYKPRELYQGKLNPYKLRGGVLGPKEGIKIVSLMRRGMVYIDGAHQKVGFEYGDSIQIKLSANPIKTIQII